MIPCTYEEGQKLAKHKVCTCGGRLEVAWGGRWNLDNYVLICGNNPNHEGYKKPDPGLDRLVAAGATEQEIKEYLESEELRRERKAVEKGTNLITKDFTPEELQKYQQLSVLDEAKARIIVGRLWKEVPDEVLVRAAMTCSRLRLNPLLKHIHLVKFKKTSAKGKRYEDLTPEDYDYEIIYGIGAKRLLANRARPFGYIDGPRIMTPDEQKAIFGKEQTDRFQAICKVGDGRFSAPGYGHWLNSDGVYGSDKGNSAANMAFIHAEAQALQRWAPGEDLRVLDEQYVELGETVEMEADHQLDISASAFPAVAAATAFADASLDAEAERLVEWKKLRDLQEKINKLPTITNDKQVTDAHIKSWFTHKYSELGDKTRGKLGDPPKWATLEMIHNCAAAMNMFFEKNQPQENKEELTNTGYITPEITEQGKLV